MELKYHLYHTGILYYTSGISHILYIRYITQVYYLYIRYITQVYLTLLGECGHVGELILKIDNH